MNDIPTPEMAKMTVRALEPLSLEIGKKINGRETRLLRYCIGQAHKNGGQRGAPKLACRLIVLIFNLTRILGHQPKGLAKRMVDADPISKEELEAAYKEQFGDALPDLKWILSDEFISAWSSADTDASKLAREVNKVINRIKRLVNINGAQEHLAKSIAQGVRRAFVYASNHAAPSMSNDHAWVVMQESKESELWYSQRRDIGVSAK